MEAIELRIGNLLKNNKPRHGDNILEVQSIGDNNSVNVFFREYSLIDLEPIPLTEEWLEKFGFTKVVYDGEEQGFGTEYELEVNEDLFMVYSDDFSVGLYAGKERINTDLSVIPAWKMSKHVHNLQNLYFALTGEELTIK